VVSDPVGFSTKEDVVHGVSGVAALGHVFESGQVLFAAAARVIELDAGVVTDVGDVVGVKEGAVVSELSRLIAVAETPGLVAHVASKDDDLAGPQGLVEAVNRVHVAGRGTDQVEWAVEVEIGDRLPEIGNVDLGDRLAGLVLEGYTDVSVGGAAFGIDIDGGIDRRDLGLEQVFVLLELAFVVRLDVAARLGIEIFVEDVSVVKVPGAGAGVLKIRKY
jgi:hypothetical protein